MMLVLVAKACCIGFTMLWEDVHLLPGAMGRCSFVACERSFIQSLFYASLLLLQQLNTVSDIVLLCIPLGLNYACQ